MGGNREVEVIILDVMLPGKNGLMFVRNYASKAATPRS